MRVVQGFEAQNIVACFREASGGDGGDALSINAPCNRPAKNPELYLPDVYWHSEFFQFELAMPVQSKTIAHTALAGKTLYYGTSASGGASSGTTSPPSGGIAFAVKGAVRETTITLVNHNLGYVPVFFVSYNGATITSGTKVQIASSGSRIVSAFATETTIGIKETAFSTDAALPAASRNYEILVCRNPVADPAKPLAGLQPDLINIWLGRGKVDTTKQYLRRVLAGESSFDLDLGPTIDIKNGGVRVVSGGNVYSDGKYNGTFAGPAFIPVGV